MFNKTIFKQSVKSNVVIWSIVTVVLTVILNLLIFLYDPARSYAISNTLNNMGATSQMSQKLMGFATLLGMLQPFYNMIAIIILLAFIIIVANNLVASEVDRGSMAYTLSAPIKRESVIFTKAAAFILSIFMLMIILTVTGTVTIQAKHGMAWGERYTVDIVAISRQTGRDRKELSQNLSSILESEELLEMGAEARKIDLDIYAIYLGLKIREDAFLTAAEMLGVSVFEVENNLQMIIDNPEVLGVMAQKMNKTETAWTLELQYMIDYATEIQLTQELMQEKMLAGIGAAAEVLEMDVADLAVKLRLIKENPLALAAALEASEMSEAEFVQAINQAMAAQSLVMDGQEDFQLSSFIFLNLGLFLLFFALSGISFFASSLFNLSKNSFAVGAGFPLLFWVLSVLSQADDSLDFLKYFTLNSLFNIENIRAGSGFLLPFLALFAVGVTGYISSIIVFKKKDLPL